MAGRPIEPRILRGALVLVALCAFARTASAYTLTVAIDDEDNRPYEFTGPDGRLTGFHVELEREVAASLGWTAEFMPVPWNRAQDMLAEGTSEAVSYLARTPERERYGIFLPDNALHTMDVVLYASRDRLAEIRWAPAPEMMARWRFGVTQGYAYNDEIGAALRAGAKAEATAITQPQLLSMLALGRIDVAVVMDSAAALDRVRATMPELDTKIAPVEGGRSTGAVVYLAFKRAGDGPARAAEFAAAYARWRGTPAYREMRQRFRLPANPSDG